MGQIKVRGKMQRVAVIDDNRVLARNVRYSTVKGNELISYASQSAHIAESNLRAATLVASASQVSVTGWKGSAAGAAQSLSAHKVLDTL